MRINLFSVQQQADPVFVIAGPISFLLLLLLF